MQKTPQAQFERDKTALKHYLIGRDYPEALAALGIAERWHVGFRKNKVTPELHHQLGVCFNFLNTPIKGLTRKLESAALAALLLHDVVEDYGDQGVTYESLQREGISSLAISFVRGMTKVDGEALEQFFDRLLAHWLLPILKGCDRDNNVMTMHGAFAVKKMKSYILETKTHILALLKSASRIFPERHRSYIAIATGIKKQLRIYESFIEAELDVQLDELNADLEKCKAQLTVLLEVNDQLRTKVSNVALANAKLNERVNAAMHMFAPKLTVNELVAFKKAIQLAISGTATAYLLDSANATAGEIQGNSKPV